MKVALWLKRLVRVDPFSQSTGVYELLKYV